MQKKDRRNIKLFFVGCTSINPYIYIHVIRNSLVFWFIVSFTGQQFEQPLSQNTKQQPQLYSNRALLLACIIYIYITVYIHTNTYKQILKGTFLFYFVIFMCNCKTQLQNHFQSDFNMCPVSVCHSSYHY